MFADPVKRIAAIVGDDVPVSQRRLLPGDVTGGTLFDGWVIGWAVGIGRLEWRVGRLSTGRDGRRNFGVGTTH